MTSGPLVAFLLVGRDAIQKVRCLAGDQDPGVAKLQQPGSLRAIYGNDFVTNAVQISESPACVEKDAALFFTTCRTALPLLAPGTALMTCSTCCVIKPHAVKEGVAGSIIDCITRANYKITAFELFYLDRTHAEEFYEIYKGVIPEYSDMTEELSLGPCYVLEISGCGEDTPASFREFVGPMNPIIAKKLRPTSIRAKFGTSTVKNAVHCTDLCLDAEMEVDYFFRILQML
ncbi:nucleoside diphosphate kinase 7-like [Folsomia candida]|uniref:nucleoside diphosphate kinase 7-like n=1 Tax=Folsomia candida TaxID=158441 RepID=UPI0016054099|nr:nucleoside diphosphate kinase 7-like [Folsomia candida]